MIITFSQVPRFLEIIEIIAYLLGIGFGVKKPHKGKKMSYFFFTSWSITT